MAEIDGMGATENGVRWVHRLKGFSRWSGVLVFAVAGSVLAGWGLHNEILKRINPGFIAMNPVTALTMMMAGAALFCFWLPSTRFTSVIARVLAGMVVLVGAVKLMAHWLDVSVPFDQILFGDQIRADTSGRPSQIAPTTAFNFLISGIALWLLNSSRGWFSRWTQNLSLTLVCVSLVPLVGYVYRASDFYDGSYVPMALHTAALFCVLGIGLLLAQSDFGVVALFTSPTPGGATARRTFPLAFGVPLLLGGLSIWGVGTKFYPSELGVSIAVVGSSAIFSALIWRNAQLLNRAALRQREAEERVKKAHDELEARVRDRTSMLNETNEALTMQITRLHAAKEKIREQAELLNKAKDAILVVNPQHQIVFWNKGAERLYGWSEAEVMGRNVDELLVKTTNSVAKAYGEIIRVGNWTGELEQVHKSAQILFVESRWTLVRDEQNQPKCILIINTDITEKRSYEEQLRVSQRMESLGALAGGVAHDLNNALTPVIIGTQLLRESKKDDDREKLLDMVSSSAKRGTEMVKQILSFARGSRGENGPVQLQHVVADMAKIVRETFPKSIALQINRKENLWTILGDVTELHQVLLNLCVNARDAMPDGGRLTLTAENVRLTKEAVSTHGNVPPGSYVVLSVADTGTGIPADVLPRIFDPFFTTKPPEKGTGLGLSTVASLVKHHNGFVEIHSIVGVGTEFKIFLPANESVEGGETTHQPVRLPNGHGELILLMDDEEAVRELTKTTLENYGYRVITAPNGLEGITQFEKQPNEIQLLITDTDMPFMDGLTAIRSIQNIRANIPIIIASGVKRDPERMRELHMTAIASLAKPYTVEQLITQVAEALKKSTSSSHAE